MFFSKKHLIPLFVPPPWGPSNGEGRERLSEDVLQGEIFALGSIFSILIPISDIYLSNSLKNSKVMCFYCKVSANPNGGTELRILVNGFAILLGLILEQNLLDYRQGYYLWEIF